MMIPLFKGFTDPVPVWLFFLIVFGLFALIVLLNNRIVELELDKPVKPMRCRRCDREITIGNSCRVHLLQEHCQRCCPNLILAEESPPWEGPCSKFP